MVHSIYIIHHPEARTFTTDANARVGILVCESGWTLRKFLLKVFGVNRSLIKRGALVFTFALNSAQFERCRKELLPQLTLTQLHDWLHKISSDTADSQMKMF